MSEGTKGDMNQRGPDWSAGKVGYVCLDVDSAECQSRSGDLPAVERKPEASDATSVQYAAPVFSRTCLVNSGECVFLVTCHGLCTIRQQLLNY